MKSSKEVKIILIIASVSLVLFSILSFLFRYYLLPLLPGNWQTSSIQYIGAFVITVTLLAGFAQITGYSLRDFSFRRRVNRSVVDNAKNVPTSHTLTQIDGTHRTKGDGEITALDIQGPAIIKPGTKSIAEGSGKITATRISNERKDEE